MGMVEARKEIGAATAHYLATVQHVQRERD